jgi:hypothetical protein
MDRKILFILLSVFIAGLWLHNTNKLECPKPVVEPYQQNQMLGGCVMQKSGGQWIRTCG